MKYSDTYAVNAPQAIEESFETEVIVVNLEIGTYFSLRDSAADAWIRITEGQSAEAICAAWTVQFPEVVSLQEDLEKFFAELLAEGLIRVEPRSAAETVKSIPFSTYQAPALEKYTDMQDLLLLDPVHDVDETGWPAPRPQ
ncbi:PqqD family protein [Bryobacter aggregatus]|uniref:PqqD family protein n=1 Tax=Bryobacter aggregatus TaxID=360054 RepID=UPI0004E26258|nr:PqqD family protein [Bryobacter aggregatus]